MGCSPPSHHRRAYKPCPSVVEDCGNQLALPVCSTPLPRLKNVYMPAPISNGPPLRFCADLASGLHICNLTHTGRTVLFDSPPLGFADVASRLLVDPNILLVFRIGDHTLVELDPLFVRLERRLMGLVVCC